MFARHAALTFGAGILVLSAARGGEPERKLVLQSPATTSICSVAISPDGSLVAAAAGAGGIRLHDARTGALLRVIDEVGDRSVVFSPDGRTLAAAGFQMDKQLKLADVATGGIIATFEGHSAIETYAAAFSPDGKLLASACRDREILVWDVATQALQYRIDDAPSVSIAFSPDGALLAGGGNDKRIRLWDAGTGRLVRTLEGHTDSVVTLCFTPDSTTLASGSCDWAQHRGRDTSNFGPGVPPPCVSEWKLWDVASGKSRRSVDEPGRLLWITLAPDGQSLAYAIDNEIRRCELQSAGPGSVVGRFDFGATSVAYTPDSADIIAGSHDQTVQRVAAATGEVQWQARGDHEQVNALAVSPDGSRLVAGSGDRRFAIRTLKAGDPGLSPGAARLWDARSGRLLQRIGNGVDQVMAVAIAPDGSRIAVAGADRSGAGVLQVCDAEGSEVWSMTDHAQEVVAVGYSPDGSLLASAGAEGTVILRDAASADIRQTFTGHERGATSVGFSSDGALLACGDGNGGVRVWDLGTRKLLQTCLAADSKAPTISYDRLSTSIVFLPGTETLYACAASVGNTFGDPVRIWQARTGDMTLAPEMKGKPIVLSPDGRVLAAGGKSVQLFEIPSGNKLHRLTSDHLKKIQAIAFSPDGRLVFGGGSYGTTNIWSAETGELLATLFAFAETECNGAVTDQWLALRPDGYYDGSLGVERYMAWRLGDEFQTGASQEHELRRSAPIAAALSK